MRLATIVAALLLLPMAAYAQQANDSASRIEAALRQAGAAGVPLSLLESRVAEGRAKGVPLDRIAAAVERRAASLTRAQDVMTRSVRGASVPDLSAAADALEAGVGPNAVAEVARSSGGDDRAVALAVLTYLHGQGIPVDQAVTQVQAALQRGPEALRTLPAQAAARGRGRGGPPANAGPPAGVGRGNSGRAGPPSGVPGPSQRPGSGRPDTPGQGGQGSPRGGPPGGG